MLVAPPPWTTALAPRRPAGRHAYREMARHVVQCSDAETNCSSLFIATSAAKRGAKSVPSSPSRWSCTFTLVDLLLVLLLGLLMMATGSWLRRSRRTAQRRAAVPSCRKTLRNARLAATALRRRLRAPPRHPRFRRPFLTKPGHLNAVLADLRRDDRSGDFTDSFSLDDSVHPHEDEMAVFTENLPAVEELPDDGVFDPILRLLGLQFMCKTVAHETPKRVDDKPDGDSAADAVARRDAPLRDCKEGPSERTVVDAKRIEPDSSTEESNSGQSASEQSSDEQRTDDAASSDQSACERAVSVRTVDLISPDLSLDALCVVEQSATDFSSGEQSALASGASSPSEAESEASDGSDATPTAAVPNAAPKASDGSSASVAATALPSGVALPAELHSDSDASVSESCSEEWAFVNRRNADTPPSSTTQSATPASNDGLLPDVVLSADLG